MYLIKRQKDLLTEYRYASKDVQFLLYQEFVRFDTDLPERSSPIHHEK